MTVWALIPARGGSKRIPRKNLERIDGLTLVARAIDVALRSAYVEQLHVSTDDSEIAIEARRCLAHVTQRPAEISGDDAPMEAVVRHFIGTVTARPDDVILLLEPTAALRVPHDLDLAVLTLHRTDAPAVRLVSSTDLECHPATYRDVGLASAIRVGRFRRCLFPRGTVLIHHGDERAIDVDEPADLERARAAVAV